MSSWASVFAPYAPYQVLPSALVVTVAILWDTNDYFAKLQAAYMPTTEQVDIQKTQLYVQNF